MAYDIHTPDDLVNILGEYILKNQTSGKSFVIHEDLDCSALKDFGPLGNGSKYSFDGELDGKGHVIKNLMIRPQKTYDLGLFTQIGMNGKVKNLRLESITIEQDLNGLQSDAALTRAGMIAAVCEGEIYGCSAGGAITLQAITETCQVGGLCGSLPFTESKISNSWADVRISFESDKGENEGAGKNKSYAAGGLVGSANGSIVSCHSRSELSGPPDQIACYIAGGICGSADSGAMVTACYNIGYLHSRAIEDDKLGCITGTAVNDENFLNCLYLKGCLLSKSFREVAKASNGIGSPKDWKALTTPGTAVSELGEDYTDTPSDDYLYTPCLKLFMAEEKECCDTAYRKALCTQIVYSYAQSVYPDTKHPVAIDCTLFNCLISRVLLTAEKPDHTRETLEPAICGNSFKYDLGNNIYKDFDFAVTLTDKYDRSVTILDVDIMEVDTNVICLNRKEGLK